MCLYLQQIQDVAPVTSYDTAGSFLILGCNNGSIYYIGNYCIMYNTRLALLCVNW